MGLAMENIQSLLAFFKYFPSNTHFFFFGIITFISRISSILIRDFQVPPNDVFTFYCVPYSNQSMLVTQR